MFLKDLFRYNESGLFPEFTTLSWKHSFPVINLTIMIGAVHDERVGLDIIIDECCFLCFIERLLFVQFAIEGLPQLFSIVRRKVSLKSKRRLFYSAIDHVIDAYVSSAGVWWDYRY